MVLVTGGTGMVGMHLLLDLTRTKQPVCAIYRTEDKVTMVRDFFAFAKADSQFKTIQWIQADLTDVPSLENAFKDITLVYHCAGFISFNPYDFHQLKKINIEGTANVVNLCLAHDVQKLVHLSSIATLAKTPNNPITEENYWDPDAHNSVYAISKYGAEMEVWRGTQEGLKVVILNPGVILGEGSYDTGSGALIGRVARGLPYYTTGSTGVIDVKTVVAAMQQAMHSDINKERFILVTHNTTYKKLLTSIASALRQSPPGKRLPTFALNMYRYYDILQGWFTKKRKLTNIGIASLQEVSVYDGTLSQEKLALKVTPLEHTLDRIAQHFLYRKGTKTV